MVVLAYTFVYQATKQWSVVRAGTQGQLVGDWLINYAGGPIRRGFFGAVMVGLFDRPGHILVALWSTQTVLYLIIFAVPIFWFVTMDDPGSWFLPLLSPAVLLFGLGDFWGTQRKEAFALAALMILAAAVLAKRHGTLAIAFAGALYLVGVASHEMNALLVVPFVILIGWMAADGTVETVLARASQIAFVVVAGLGVLFALIAPGTAVQQREVCDRLVDIGFDEVLCGGSIFFLGQSLVEAQQSVAFWFDRYWLYGVVVALALLPVALLAWARSHWPILLATSAGVVPLFVVGADWGRWVMLMTTLMTVIAYVGSTRAGIGGLRVPAVVVAVYLLTWRVPHFDISVDALAPHTLFDVIVRSVHELFR